MKRISIVLFLLIFNSPPAHNKFIGTLEQNMEGKGLQLGAMSTESSKCTVHKITLAELYQIVKEEANMFQNCIYSKNQQESEVADSDPYDCLIYRETLKELFDIVKEEANIYEDCLATSK